MDNLLRAHFAGGLDLRFTFYHCNHVASNGLRNVHEHQADRPAADDGDGIADFNAGLVQSTQHAGQRFDHGSFFKAYVRRNHQRVQVNNPPRNADVLGISAVVEQQVFAQIFLVA